ncbi:uncharacterized protein [Dermacentor andersoni]|uniref:uncharacterized protein n=1 Tax=Dermacentor andersoni TaxID=34620 RepID=UPI002415EE8C|nr:uncharacterized protein LOC126533891 [Dermacentor andersoni]
MSLLPAAPKKLSSGGQKVIAAARQEFGMHMYFNEPFSAATKDFRVELSQKFAKNSKLTIVVEVLPDSFMEICYETLEDSNRYFYVSRDPVDGKLYAGTKLLEYPYNHHRQDLPLNKTKLDTGKPYVIQLEWKADDSIEFYLDGSASITGTKPAGTMLKDCARLVPGELFPGDTSKTLRGFTVYEVHHSSPTWESVFEENYSYTLPAQYVLASNVLMRISGKCIMREYRTGEIKVYYDGQVAAILRRLQKNKPMTVVIKLSATEMIISLVGAPVPAPPVTVPLVRSTVEPSLKVIRVTRNLQTHNVEIISGISPST